MKEAETGAAQRNVSKEAIESYIIEVCCLKEKKKIADFLTSIYNEIDKYTKTLE